MVLQIFSLCTVVRKIVFVPSLLLLAGAMLSDKETFAKTLSFNHPLRLNPTISGKKLEAIQCCEASYILDTEAVSIFDHFLFFPYI